MSEQVVQERYLSDHEATKLGKVREDIDWKETASHEAYLAFADGLTKMIELVGDNPERNGLQETPFRVFKAFTEYTKGYAEDPVAILGKNFDVVFDELVLIKNIPFSSLCEHHFATFHGHAHIAYIPKNNAITGLSKFARLTDAYANRFQVQERLTAQIADTIVQVLDPLGVAVIIDAEHACMCHRGVKKSGASTVTSAMRGVFRDKPEARAELMALIK